MAADRPKLAVIIVAFRNPEDVDRCLKSLARSDWQEFEVFVCENGGPRAFERLGATLVGRDRTLQRIEDEVDTLDKPGGRLAAVTKCRFQHRANVVRLGLAVDNLGYGGGVNTWLEQLLGRSGWEAVLVLNPDTEVDHSCLTEFMMKAGLGFGMIGGTLVFDSAPNKIINCGLRWSPQTGRVLAVGRNLPAGTSPTAELLSGIDAISGACVLVTRSFVEDVGLMAEDYFLYMEDLDWGRRGRGRHQIGFAEKAIVRHVGGTAIGSAVDPKERSPLSVYLSARNSILYARRWAGWRWILHFAFGLLYAIRYVLLGTPSAAKITLKGLIDGAKGKTGRPDSSLWPDGLARSVSRGAIP
ncbi:glycosyltransferase family 2 protein [Bradyrhizobium sp. CSA112]|uniref:glycosyltransferase family 2 protein n=1 Tax=Bradyrhizobium sp. CSA112 TaxID=2699170 RepID=UPI0023AEDAB8|nr:glycosyltransferase family 2 protein [Bradyrhizobium sp. CSA112]MDE5452807.1 glycosyltransferase family 2 protein [Bradyrhizobium sp. CSA112]